MPPQGEVATLGPSSSNDTEEDVLGNDRYCKHVSMDQIDPHAPVTRTSVYRRESFIMHFATSRGPPQVVILCLLLALALGSTIGVVPAVITDRYARLNHGYESDQDCASIGKEDKPIECLEGSSDAQNAAAITSLVSNMLTFTTSSLVGSISDEKGRKGVLVLGIFLSLLAPFCLVLLQIFDDMSPTWYYVASGCTGVVNWIAVALSTLSDVMPPKWRAPTFGLLLAGFSCGFALAPMLALALDHFGVSVLAFSLLVLGFFFSVFFLPETLPVAVSEEAARCRRARSNPDETTTECIVRNMLRPMKELSILNRSRLFRLMSALAFFSGMVASADHTLLLYYVEERLDFDDHDVAVMFMIVGLLGIFVQAIVLKPLNDCIGERLVVVVAFLFGTGSNILYGIATTKAYIFAGISLSSFCGMSFPTISAIKSNNVDESEQGRIQGALYSLSALASAVGPVSLRFVYHHTKDSNFPGPGSMFIFAAGLYFLATVFACALPKDQANSAHKEERDRILRDDDENVIESYGTALL